VTVLPLPKRVVPPVPSSETSSFKTLSTLVTLRAQAEKLTDAPAIDFSVPIVPSVTVVRVEMLEAVNVEP
jgi:hypothetical protein